MFGLSKKTTVSIQGMSCGHCEMKVANALRKLDGVKNASASVKDANAVIEHSGALDFDKAAQAVEAAGYKLVR